MTPKRETYEDNDYNDVNNRWNHVGPVGFFPKAGDACLFDAKIEEADMDTEL